MVEWATGTERALLDKVTWDNAGRVARQRGLFVLCCLAIRPSRMLRIV